MTTLEHDPPHHVCFFIAVWFTMEVEAHQDRGPFPCNKGEDMEPRASSHTHPTLPTVLLFEEDMQIILTKQDRFSHCKNGFLPHLRSIVVLFPSLIV